MRNLQLSLKGEKPNAIALGANMDIIHVCIYKYKLCNTLSLMFNYVTYIIYYVSIYDINYSKICTYYLISNS